LVIATTGSIGTVLILANFRDSARALRENAIVHARGISNYAESAILLNDHVALERVLRAATMHRDLAEIHIFDADINELASADPLPDPERSYMRGLYKSLQIIQHPGSYVVRPADDRFHVYVPIMRTQEKLDVELLDGQQSAPDLDRPIGYVALGYSLVRIRGELASRVRSSILVSLIVIAVGTGLTIVLVKQLLRPLKNLIDATVAIAGGDRSRRVQEDALPEFATLARSFNRMADRLQESYSSIERTIEQRTAELTSRTDELETEITTRERIESALRASQQQRDAIINSIDGIVWEAEPNTFAFQFVSERAENLLGYPVAQWLDQPDFWFRHIHPDDVQWAVDYCANAVRGLEDHQFEYRMIAADGRVIWMRDIVSVVAENDRPVRLCGVMFDVTTRKQAEVELERAKNAAEQANRVKRDFLANMSHEIRTPMTAILGFAENLLDPELSESDSVQVVRTIRRNGNHLMQIINDILDISKIEAGKLQIERLLCSPVQIIEEVRSLMQPRATAKRLEFDVRYQGKLPASIETDPMRLRQVLINLVTNAVKFTNEGGVRIEVELDENDSDPRIRFRVVDTGLGMSPDQLQSVFQPFTQADETTTRRFGGTGLGLAICRHLVQALGGKIDVDSTLGRGTTFSFSVRTGKLDGVERVDVTSELSSATASNAAPDAAAAAPRLDASILVAEDGPDNQRLISFILKKAGARVEIAENGQVAVDKALEARQAGEPYDVILMDMQMPVLDGYEATRTLRRDAYDLPIIALTAHAMATDRDKCIAAGCDDYATKPLDRRKLIELIAQTCAERRGVRSPT